MIKATLKQQIIDDLDSNTHFNRNDFVIVVGETSAYSGTKVTINYQYEPQYSFHVDIPTKKVETEKSIFFKMEGEICPGELSFVERFEVKGLNGLSSMIRSWLSHLWQELLYLPINRTFQKAWEEIDILKNKLEDIPDEYFSKEEGDNLKQKLNNLESSLTEKLLSDTNDKEQAKAQVTKLHEEIEDLKQTIFSLKKQGWFKSFISKTMTWLSDPTNQKLLKNGTEIVMNMLPDGKK